MYNKKIETSAYNKKREKQQRIKKTKDKQKKKRKCRYVAKIGNHSISGVLFYGFSTESVVLIKRDVDPTREQQLCITRTKTTDTHNFIVFATFCSDPCCPHQIRPYFSTQRGGKIAKSYDPTSWITILTTLVMPSHKSKGIRKYYVH